VVYRRYAGLFFCACVDANDNELAYLEAIHFFVEVLDQFFGNVCELDLVFNFYKVSVIEGFEKGWGLGIDPLRRFTRF
jgi:AP-2 complex subunit sigma-1